MKHKKKDVVVKAGKSNRSTGAKVVSFQSKSIKKPTQQAAPPKIKAQPQLQSSFNSQHSINPVSFKQVNQSSISVAIQTANAIASNNSHPNQSQVSELLSTFEKGWIDEKKFVDILKTLMF